MRFLILSCLLTLSICSCKSDKEEFSTGVVIKKQGCYPDSYLVEILHQAPRDRAFLCADMPLQGMTHNCTNAVFTHLPTALADPGQKIRFVYDGTEVSCLSAAGAPQHIRVKSLLVD